ncbi:RHS repeat protein [Vallitalea pronyensis]|uniref:RHS repeat protein n=1 Tax=Vallitalea pronyensis TaxID=1348613 RepID=A0A8J8SFU4_9FIRM|nr:RHS repeat domain-containing protein [Vallitalea pronyensis]QUI22060.1 RHS repeat protein [Vallitalea pronyensis]
MVSGKYAQTTTRLTGDATITPAPVKQYHDKLGRLVKAETDHHGKTYQTTYNYDYVGNKTEGKDARAYDEGWSEPTVTYEYDHANRVVKETNTMGQSIHTVYDPLGRVKSKTDYKGSTTTYGYDKLGRLLKVQAPVAAGQFALTKYDYDKNGNQTAVKQQCNKPGQPEAWRTTGYGYDSRNRLVKVVKNDTDGSQSIAQYHYDGAGNKTKMFTGLSAALDTSSETGQDTDFAVTRYGYNHLNQMVSMTDPLGQ